jgi:hypothetical protein
MLYRIAITRASSSWKAASHCAGLPVADTLDRRLADDPPLFRRPTVSQRGRSLLYITVTFLC